MGSKGSTHGAGWWRRPIPGDRQRVGMGEAAEVHVGGLSFDFGRWRGGILTEEHTPWQPADGTKALKNSFVNYMSLEASKLLLGLRPTVNTTLVPLLSHPVFKAKTRCSSYVCPGSSCHTYGQNVSTEYQYLYYIVSYYNNLLQFQKGLNSGMDPILPQAVDWGFRTPRRNLHQHTPHLLSSRT
jgi:hypothetical protein